MYTCNVTNLPITENRNWRAVHKENGYDKVIKRLGDDIILYCIDTDHDISLESMDVDILRTVLHDSNLDDKPICLVWDMKHITSMSYRYKTQIVNLIYNPTLTFGIVIFYNVEPEFLTMAETFAAMVPENLPVLIKQDYTDAVKAALDWKKGVVAEDIYESEEDRKYDFQKKEFLASLGRLSWLNMMDQKISLPPIDDKLFPFFKALENLQNDLLENAKEKEHEVEQISQDGEEKLMKNNVQLNAQKELYSQLKSQFEKEKSALTARISSQEMELTRISTAIAEKTSTLRELLDLISSLDIDQEKKRVLIEHCRNMIDTEMIEKRLNIELTTTDSEFLSKLQRTHPHLNQRELRICLLIKLNYNTRDIARSVGISTRGMESIRYRMHKKIGLTKHQSLKSYLTDLAAHNNSYQPLSSAGIKA